MKGWDLKVTETDCIILSLSLSRNVYVKNQVLLVIDEWEGYNQGLYIGKGTRL